LDGTSVKSDTFLLLVISVAPLLVRMDDDLRRVKMEDVGGGKGMDGTQICIVAEGSNPRTNNKRWKDWWWG
jgi:hypothetical protein